MIVPLAATHNYTAHREHAVTMMMVMDDDATMMVALVLLMVVAAGTLPGRSAGARPLWPSAARPGAAWMSAPESPAAAPAAAAAAAAVAG